MIGPLLDVIEHSLQDLTRSKFCVFVSFSFLFDASLFPSATSQQENGGWHFKRLHRVLFGGLYYNPDPQCLAVDRTDVTVHAT